MPSVPFAGAPKNPTFRPARPVVIGLLGGIAAGKSTVALIFANHGLRHVDADALARKVSVEAAVVSAVARALGPGLIEDGHLNRPAVAELVFRDATARRQLEAILHPRIRVLVLAELAAARQHGDSVLLDAPLLLESGLIAHCDHVVFVDATTAVRASRAAARGWTMDELARREQAQAPLDDKRARAQHCIQNDGDLAASRAQVATLLQTLAAKIS